MVAKKSPAIIAKEAERCYELAAAGMSTRAIAEQMGFSQSVVVRRMHAHIKEHEHRNADKWRELQMTDLMNLRKRLQKQVETGDIKAIGQAVRIWERISRMLGTDAATAYVVKADVNTREGDHNAFLDMLLDLQTRRGEDTTIVKGEIVEREKAQAEGRPMPPRRKRPLKDWVANDEPVPSTRSGRATDKPATTPASDIEFADDVEIEEFEPVKADPQNYRPRRGRARPNPASRFLVDSDD